MKRIPIFLVIFFCTIAVVFGSWNYASAVPLNLTETTDFATTNTGTTDLGSFDVGLNIVSGSVARLGGVAPGDYGDFWDATLLAGMQITSIEIQISNHSNQPGFFVGAADNIVGGFGPFAAQAYADLSSDGIYTLAATVGAYPFSPGQYYFGAATNVGTTTAYDYEWRITVASASVPEPSTLLLLGSGLAGLGYYVRRQYKS